MILEREGIIILAGGSGLRMGKVVKALVNLNNKPLITYVVDKALKVSTNIGVVIGKNYDQNMFRKVIPSFIPIWKDELEGKGPVVGLLTGMKKLEATYIAALSCDIPFLNPEALKVLFKEIKGGFQSKN